MATDITMSFSIILIVSTIFIAFILYKKDSGLRKAIAGLATIMLGIGTTGISSKVAGIEGLTFAFSMIIMFTGAYIVLEGAVMLYKKGMGIK